MVDRPWDHNRVSGGLPWGILPCCSSLIAPLAVALAFATLENMAYALNHGLDLLLLPSFLSTTGHVMLALVWDFGFTAVMFGDTRRRARDYLRVSLFIYPAKASCLRA